MFSCEFSKISKNTFFYRISPVAVFAMFKDLQLKELSMKFCWILLKNVSKTTCRTFLVSFWLWIVGKNIKITGFYDDAFSLHLSRLDVCFLNRNSVLGD